MNFKINPFLLALVMVIGILLYYIRVILCEISDSYNAIKSKIKYR